MSDTQLKLEADWDTFCAIESEIGAAETTGIDARWRCGKLLFGYEKRERSKNSPLALAVEKLSRELTVSKQELYYRRQFFEIHPTPENCSNALEQFGSWRDIVGSFPPDKPDYERNTRGVHEGIKTSDGDSHGPSWMLLLGDMQQRGQQIGAGSIDAIITDPPYPHEFLPLWTDLGELAARVLRPGGALLARCGHLYIPQVLAQLEAHLQFGWMYVEPLPGSNVRFQGRKIAVSQQPWVAFSNGPWPSGRIDWHPDTLTESPRVKERYVWQQKWQIAAEVTATFTKPGGHVLDPFAGSGSYGEAALAVGCNWTGIERDPIGHANATERLTALAQEQAA